MNQAQEYTKTGVELAFKANEQFDIHRVLDEQFREIELFDVASLPPVILSAVKEKRSRIVASRFLAKECFDKFCNGAKANFIDTL